MGWRLERVWQDTTEEGGVGLWDTMFACAIATVPVR